MNSDEIRDKILELGREFVVKMKKEMPLDESRVWLLFDGDQDGIKLTIQIKDDSQSDLKVDN